MFNSLSLLGYAGLLYCRGSLGLLSGMCARLTYSPQSRNVGVCVHMGVEVVAALLSVWGNPQCLTPSHCWAMQGYYTAGAHWDY